jgi:hypothetical protein
MRRALDRRIYKVMRGSWANHYRRMLPSLLSVQRPVERGVAAGPGGLDWIRSKVDGGCRFVPLQDVPIDEVIPARWRSSVIDDDGRVNRISYELCVLTQLRDRIAPKKSGWSGRIAIAIPMTIFPRTSRSGERRTIPASA